jgi:signal transduction histidine kinase
MGKKKLIGLKFMTPRISDAQQGDLAPVSAQMDKQFKWLARAGRLSGMSMMVVDKDLEIQFYDNMIVELLELDSSLNYTGRNMLRIVDQLASRGDFGPGDPKLYVDLVKAQLSKNIEDLSSEPNLLNRKLNFLTPSGRRIEFKMDFALDGLQVFGCRDITKTFIEKHALKVALDSSHSGYQIYDMETQEFQIPSDKQQNSYGQPFNSKEYTKDLQNRIHPEDYKKLKSLAQRACAQGESWSGTFRTNDADGNLIWVKAQATPQIAESGAITSYIIFYTEVTSQLRIQNDLRKTIEQSEKSLSAKNAFLGRLSHEIRTPMNAVVGIADALIHHNGDPAIQSKLELIQTSAEKIIRIVDESLEHTKLAESKLQLDPHAASPIESIKSVCALWEQKALENDIELIYRLDQNVPETIIFDSYRYEQCLNNLLSNAVKFSPAGKIQVVLTTMEKDGKNNLITVVKDSGIGMSPSQLTNLFEAYTQADSSISSRFGGTGLGMNITKQLIELMGGNITAKSELGSGTVIALTLPIQSNRRRKDRRRETSGELVDQILDAATTSKSEYGALKVLVVDDNDTNHLVMTSLLGELVKEIGVASNGTEAIQALEDAETANAQYDVILMDIHMPIMDGIEATLSIRGSKKNYTDIPIIALTADPQYQQRRLCKNIGMDDALAKPVKLTEVLGALDRVFDVKNTSELAA